MRSRKKLVLGIAAAAVGLALALTAWKTFWPPRHYMRFDGKPDVAPGPFSYEQYAQALRRYVNAGGLVDYRGLKANRAGLDSFARQIGGLDPKMYDRWNDREKIAFLINAYNAFTLEAIIANYPIRPSFGRSLLFPKNSIVQIPGVWTRLDFQVMGHAATLDDIEHNMIRKNFDEPRIHFALVCASMGCPPLRDEPFVAERLDEQLNDQVRRFLSDPRKFRIDSEAGVVDLSSIFKWYGHDFTKSFGTNEQYIDRSEDERAVMNFISGYVDEADRNFLRSAKYRIEYMRYDWSLNQQTSG